MLKTPAATVAHADCNRIHSIPRSLRYPKDSGQIMWKAIHYSLLIANLTTPVSLLVLDLPQM
jgi:hypothetical protein